MIILAKIVFFYNITFLNPAGVSGIENVVSFKNYGEVDHFCKNNEKPQKIEFFLQLDEDPFFS